MLTLGNNGNTNSLLQCVYIYMLDTIKFSQSEVLLWRLNVTLGICLLYIIGTFER